MEALGESSGLPEKRLEQGLTPEPATEKDDG